MTGQAGGRDRPAVAVSGVLRLPIGLPGYAASQMGMWVDVDVLFAADMASDIDPPATPGRARLDLPDVVMRRRRAA